jgi:hypothetical protein
MRLLTALGLTVALLAGCSEPVASTAPIGVPLTPLPSTPLPLYEKPSEVAPATCEKLEAAFAEVFGAELEWRQKRLSNKKFEEVLRVINEELSLALFGKDANGFQRVPMMPEGADMDFAYATLPLRDAYWLLFAVITPGVVNYPLIKESLRDARYWSNEWMYDHCDSAD